MEASTQKPAESNGNSKEGVMENKLSSAIEELNLKQVKYLVGKGALVTEDVTNQCIQKIQTLDTKTVFRKGGRKSLGKQQKRAKQIKEFLESNLSATVGDDNHNEVGSNAYNDQNIQPIDPEIVNPLNYMVATSSDRQATVSNSEGSSGSGILPAIKNAHKSKWPTITAYGLAIAGIASGLAIAFYLEMLAVGIAVATLCVIGATALYCCWPKSLVEDSNITEVAATKAPAAS